MKLYIIKYTYYGTLFDNCFNSQTILWVKVTISIKEPGNGIRRKLIIKDIPMQFSVHQMVAKQCNWDLKKVPLHFRYDGYFICKRNQ